MARTTTPSIGTIGGYTILRREPLDRLEGTYLELEHDRTGARHIHIQCATTTTLSPCSSLQFPRIRRASPASSSAWCSPDQAFPVRDPFFSMTRRSLATFMNAFTSADWTMYPFSTRNAKDFTNLLEVYLDATFFPRLSEDSFMQEGVRFEFEDPSDPSSGLRYKGVVFNEMKGALASPQAAVQTIVGRALFPGTTYAHISGGDPEHIPDLTWEHLRNFHSVHYHPSNAYFYTYGDKPLEETLAAIEENALQHFERIDVTHRSST
jgi:Zn-dependent M16 (insulinase) family peptidase